jgi:predicted MFS family arabinose efflux permease
MTTTAPLIATGLSAGPSTGTEARPVPANSERSERSEPAARETPGARASLRLSPMASLYLLASIVVSLLAASSAPTPLYAIYQAKWGFSAITTTIVFGIYAIAVLSSLLVVGKLSDHVGRRPVLFVALVVQALALVVFANADGVPALLAGRIVQGLATGAAIAAVGAGLLDINRVKGALANSVVPMLGVGTGGLLSGLLVQYAAWPTHLVYYVLIGVFALQFAGVVLMRETVTRKAGALASLKPEFALPRAVRGPALLAAPVLIAVWALGGFFASLGPALTRVVTGSHSIALGGLALFVLAAPAAIITLVLRNVAPRRVMGIGIVALLVGVGTILLAVDARSGAWFFIGGAIAGTGFGAGFQGAIRSVIPLAHPHERAGVLSALYVISYLAMGAPAVVAGFLVVDAGGLLSAVHDYGIAVMVLAALALIGLVRRARPVDSAV